MVVSQMGFLEDMYQMKLDAQLHDRKRQLDAISNLFNQLTSGVNELYEQLEEAKSDEVEFYSDYHVYEAFNELHTRYDRFWDEANAAREQNQRNTNWDLFAETIQNRLHPLALEYVEPAGKLAGNLPNVVAMCMFWPVVNAETEKAKKHLEFDYSEFDEIDFDPNVLLELQEQMFQAYDAMSALGDNLIEEWEPFGDYEDNGWREEFEEHLQTFNNAIVQIEKYANHARSLFRSLWEIKKQVELSQGAAKQIPADDAITRIEKLAALLEKGLITKAEFDEKKAKLMEEI
jgi:hypothetical protein